MSYEDVRPAKGYSQRALRCWEYQEYKEMVRTISRDGGLSLTQRTMTSILGRSLERWYDVKCVEGN